MIQTATTAGDCLRFRELLARPLKSIKTSFGIGFSLGIILATTLHLFLQTKEMHLRFIREGIRNTRNVIFPKIQDFRCEPDLKANFVFYNRLPKSGSSTILNITKFLRNNGSLLMVGLRDPDHYYHPYGIRPIHDYIYHLEAEVLFYRHKHSSAAHCAEARHFRARCVGRRTDGRRSTSSHIATRTLWTSGHPSSRPRCPAPSVTSR